MKKLLFILVLVTVCTKMANCQTLLYSDNFKNGLTNWITESESDSLKCSVENNILDIIAHKGFTLWYRNILEGDLKITFDALVVSENGKYDRVSDLNCFWMANDPENPDDFFARSKWRNGVFGKYYSLTMYYVGYGGNSNTTTRFRRYNGDYQSFLNKTMRPDIIKEYTDTAHLIKPNCWNRIEIIAVQNKVKYIFNNELLFDYNDLQPYKKGYFGIRTTTNHLKIRNFQVIKTK
ncbi:MAG: DUF6250 domain-containing protein [Bacteroidia bacterium]|nr:DUF6250 domain-containing protein [Bacteroidia bacterium]